MALNAWEQLERFKALLRDGPYPKEHPLFKQALTWVKAFPGDLADNDKQDVRRLMCVAFELTEEELRQETVGELVQPEGLRKSAQAIEDELWELIPRGGFFERYARYTSHSEAPLAYHLFSALVAIGATVNRRVWFDMGYYKLFPNLGVIILGPSGIKKTSASNIAVSMLTELEITKVYSEKLTPEQLVEAMKDMAQGLIYAPEMAVFLGKQRYMEGIVPLITRFMDCPDVWSSETVMRGKKTLRDIAVSSLMCSTLEWFISNTSEDVISGGFMARNIIVAQETSPRLEPVPKPGSSLIRTNLMGDLAHVHTLEGELTFTKEAYDYYVYWYNSTKDAGLTAEHELLRTYHQRKPDHVKRVAMCLHLADHSSLVLDLGCFQRALSILDWIEQFLPSILRQMFKTASGHEQDLVLNAVRAAGGVIEHSMLLRRLQYKFNAAQLKTILESLKSAEQLLERADKLMHVWALKPQEEDT